jgi:hypothetical protein
VIISYSHRFIFIHVPKTAGMSISGALAPYAHRTEHMLVNRLLALVGIHVNHYAHYKQKRFRLHTAARIVRRHLPARVYDDFFKFAFVRNPWDRLVSQYHYILRSRTHHRHRLVTSMSGFQEYVRYELRRNKPLQKDVVTDRRGRLIVDFVGRYERLERDFAAVCRTLNIEAVLPHVNRTLHRDYRCYYDPPTIERVASHFREDIDFFGYTFDDGLTRAAAA